MKFYLFLSSTFFVIFFSACKKKQAAKLEENVACQNVTQTIPDSLLTLITSYTSISQSILKIQYGLTSTVATQPGFYFWGPSIAPDKTKFICFKSTSSVNNYATAELWLFNIDGSNGHLLTTLSAQSLTGMGMAKWAPDGLHIVFAGEKNEIDGNLHWNVYTTDTLGTLGIKMNTRLGSFKYPNFANGDMSKLVYEAWNVGIVNAGSVFDTEIHTATLNAGFQFTSETQISSNEFLEYSPCYSPDNLSIVYCQNTSLAAGTAVELYTRDLSSSTSAKILSNNHINENPVWCTVNNMIYFNNKTGSACFNRCNRVDASGAGEAVVYQLVNTLFLQIDIK